MSRPPSRRYRHRAVALTTFLDILDTRSGPRLAQILGHRYRRPEDLRRALHTYFAQRKEQP